MTYDIGGSPFYSGVIRFLHLELIRLNAKNARYTGIAQIEVHAGYTGRGE
jgi:hypothetical protein